MKTRIIQTRFWDDEFVSNLEIDAKLIFLYLITNDSIGMTGIYEKPKRYIAFHCGISEQRLVKILESLREKIIYDNGWVVILNAVKYNNYASNPAQRKAYMKEYNALPERLKEYAPYFDDVEEYSPKYKKGNRLNYRHREIAEEVLGRELTRDEVVHHIDRNPSNNNIDNLAVMPSETHIKFHKGEIELDDTSVILLSHYCDTSVTVDINKNKEIINKNKGVLGEKDLEEPKETKKTEIDLVTDRYNEKFNKKAQVTDMRREKLKARRKRFSLEDILMAVDAFAYSKFHHPEDTTKWCADLDFILRSDENIDKGMNMPRPKNKDHPAEYSIREEYEISPDDPNIYRPKEKEQQQ